MAARAAGAVEGKEYECWFWCFSPPDLLVLDVEAGREWWQSAQQDEVVGAGGFLDRCEGGGCVRDDDDDGFVGSKSGLGMRLSWAMDVGEGGEKTRGWWWMRIGFRWFCG